MTWLERAAPILVVLVLTCGCGPEPEGFLLRPLVGSKTFTVAPDQVPEGLSFERAPEVAELTIDYERRPVVLTSPGTWRWRGIVPEEGARFHAGVQLLPAAWKAVETLEIRLVARDEEGREILDHARVLRSQEPRWIDLDADLSRYAGSEVTIELSSNLRGLPTGHRDANLVAWGPVSLSNPVKETERPNILFILVDTLRHDHLTPYGYKRDTSPEIQSRLALPGAVVEEAYSQAPWTLPSVVSFLTGRYPGDLLGTDVASFGIPSEIEPLPALLARLGYQTGGFIANPSLHAGAGFERGFRTFFAPPADIKWMQKHADDLNAHAIPWLRAHQDRPFFAYVHYIDPHDPYYNPDMDRFGGRSPFDPGYTGPVAGNWIHGIYNGRLQLADPARDVPYIRALYDSEVRYVDRHIGELLSALDPRVLANTLVVLTADHGEELYDHGGWKHGQTLYEEQIHVPLIFRWDSRIKPGTRLRGTARLVDLVPTLAEAAGMKADPEWDGVSLLPALTGRGALPRRPAFAQHLSSGPLRAAAVLNGKKLILYNEREAFQPADAMQAHLFGVDTARLRRQELYDLTKDPKESRNLFPEDQETAAELAPAIHRELEEHLPGLWVLTEGALPGSRLSGTITFQRAPQRWVPYFLGDADRVELSGNRITFDLAAEHIAKGFRVEGDAGRAVSVDVSENGRPLPSIEGRLGLFRHQGRAVNRRQADPETERRLRSLGYIQ
ncbi:MAG TPA: sulfatase [Thermoanaerobaculia bacterium]|nr:sulfatase [Thermoanaerobaculia bacterium]